MNATTVNALTTKFIDGVLVCDNHQMSDENLDTLLELLTEEKNMREWKKTQDK